MDYCERMRELCGDPAACRFPQSYFGNLRLWDYERILESGLGEGDTVLDVGALHTYFGIYASHLVAQYFCTDNFYWYERGYAKPETHQCPAEWCNYMMMKGKNLTAEAADIQNLPYRDGQFDKVICISTIEHVLDDRRGVDEMMRVLRPGGLLLLTTEYNPTWSKPYDESDHSYYRVYDDAGIDNLFAGYAIEQRVPHFTPAPGEFTTLFLTVRKS